MTATLLTWFPCDPDLWDKLTEALTLEEEGALFHVARRAWRDPEAPCTIAGTDASLEKLLGTRWRKLATVIRAHFTPDAENPGRLRWPWLWALYQKQLAAYENRARAGKSGGRPKRPSGKQSPSNAKALLSETPGDREAKLPQIVDGGMIPSRDHHPPSADGARGAALTGAAAPAPEGERAVPPPEWRSQIEQLRAACADDDAERAARVERRSQRRRTADAPFAPLSALMPAMAQVES